MSPLTLTAALAMLTLATSSVNADGVLTSAEAQYVPELALLTWGQARAAEGHRALYKVVLDSRPGDSDRFIAFDCVGPQNDQRTVWLRLGETPADTMVVDAQMELVWHAPSKDVVFPGHWEFRLLDAVRVT